MLVGQTLLMEDRAHGERNTILYIWEILMAMDERDLFTKKSSNGYWQVRTADGRDRGLPRRHQVHGGTVYGEMYPADFNGDGRTDFFYPKSERLL